jgi:hypothetical protein
MFSFKRNHIAPVGPNQKFSFNLQEFISNNNATKEGLLEQYRGT